MLHRNLVIRVGLSRQRYHHYEVKPRRRKLNQSVYFSSESTQSIIDGYDEPVCLRSHSRRLAMEIDNWLQAWESFLLPYGSFKKWRGMRGISCWAHNLWMHRLMMFTKVWSIWGLFGTRRVGFDSCLAIKHFPYVKKLIVWTELGLIALRWCFNGWLSQKMCPDFYSYMMIDERRRTMLLCKNKQKQIDFTTFLCGSFSLRFPFHSELTWFKLGPGLKASSDCICVFPQSLWTFRMYFSFFYVNSSRRRMPF